MHPRAHIASGPTCPSNPCLNYHGGPVLHSNTGYVIDWQPAGAPSSVKTFPTGYTAAIDTYLAHVQAADGVFNNVYSVATQYTDGAGNVGYGFTRAPAISDTNPLPASGCTDPAASTNPCLTDAQIQTEISNVITAHSLPRGVGSVFFLITPQGLMSCINGLPANGCYDYSGGYCAYHNDFNSGSGETIYANQPYGAVTGCNGPDQPNNNPADDTISTLSHEHIEMMTDPEGSAMGTTPAWYHDGTSLSDPNTGFEIADLCSTDYGSPVGSTASGSYNQSIDGGTYLLQTEWSNADNTCEQGQPPTVTLAPVPNAYRRQTVAFSATSNQSVTYQWNFGDGATASGAGAQTHTYAMAGTYTVSVSGVNPGSGLSSRAVSQTVSVVNAQPVAVFVISPTAPTTGQVASFDASGSLDTGGAGITGWSWNFGDGTLGFGGPVVTHLYSMPGPTTVTLTVTDADGLTSTSSQTVNIQVPLPPKPIALAAISVANGQTLRRLLHHGIVVAIRCTGACTAGSRLMLHTLLPSGHHGRRTKLVDVGDARAQAGANGFASLTIKLTTKGRRLLRNARKSTFTLIVDAAGMELSKALNLR